MTQWFTSDLHFAHPHVAKLRGFEDYREHDETIIRNLLSVATRKHATW
ncbi:MAG TPA: hypothetical protein K8W03_01505 [Bifidobacterium pseudolongum subsp. globosum]|nr:hypothetical protein [Bifidobacterium pseudolongum subsp. globosum]